MAVIPESRVTTKLLSVFNQGLDLVMLTTVPAPLVNRMLLMATHPQNVSEYESFPYNVMSQGMVKVLSAEQPAKAYVEAEVTLLEITTVLNCVQF